eukprot:jgi/Astpho2/4329/Aster-07418
MQQLTASMNGLSFKQNIACTRGLTAQRQVPCPERSARMPVVENRVAIRFQRRGRKKLPFYRIVAIDTRKQRDGKPIEYLGWHNPLADPSSTQTTSLNAPAIKKWLGCGAQPSDRVRKLLEKAFVIES